MPYWNRPDNHPHPDEVRMTLGEHLEELRTRVVRALAALMIGAILCWVFRDYVMAFLTWPIYDALLASGQPPELFNIHPTETFILELKIAFIAGFIIVAPYALTQIWGFVAAGLYPNERRWVRRFVPVSIALFFVGALFMALVVAPIMFSFFVSYRVDYPDPSKLMPWLGSSAHLVPATPTTQPAWETYQAMPAFTEDPKDAPEGVPWVHRKRHEIHVRFGEKVYSIGRLTEVRSGNQVVQMLSIADSVLLLLEMMAAFGIGFQMPVVVALLSTIGVASAKDMSKFRRHVYFAIAIASAVITPSPDALSMISLMAPMMALFEVGLVAARVIERQRGTS